MKKIIFVLLIILMIQNVSSITENYNDVKELEMNLQIDLRFRLDNLNRTRFNDLTADMFLKPQDSYMQTVKNLELSMIPDGTASERLGLVRYEWRSPKNENVYAKLKATITNSNSAFVIRRKVKYPIEYDENKDYLGETKFIDINEDIRNLAKDFVDTDDLFLISVKAAEWVRRNIKYNLSSLNANAVFKSSDVLEKGEGVCDELTNLFISIMRSLGVPARFITGVVYSNLGYKWSNHGWAEVYFPNYGWVPFDVTFGQYGWIDPSHIKLQENVGSGEASVNYRWHSVGGDVKLENIDLDTKYVNSKEGFESPIKLSVRADNQNVKFGSFIPVIVDVENLKDYYVSPLLYLSNAPGVYGDNEKIIVLRPNEKKSFVFIVDFNGNFKNNFIYSSDVKVKSHFGDVSSIILHSAEDYKFYSLDEALNVLKFISERGKKTEFNDLIFNCKGDKDSYIHNESGKVKCNFLMNETYRNITLCLINECKNLDLINNTIVDFNVDFGKSVNGVIMSAENSNFFTMKYVDLNVKKDPTVLIEALEIDEISYNEKKFVNLSLKSNTLVKNVVVKLNGYEFNKLDELDGYTALKLEIDGGMVYSSKALVEVSYLDEFGNRYYRQKLFDVNVEGVPTFWRIIGWIKGIFE